MPKVYASKEDVLDVARTIATEFPKLHPGVTGEEARRAIFSIAKERVDENEGLLEQAFYAGIDHAVSSGWGPLDYYGLRSGSLVDETMVPENPIYQHAVATCYLTVMAVKYFEGAAQAQAV